MHRNIHSEEQVENFNFYCDNMGKYNRGLQEAQISEVEQGLHSKVMSGESKSEVRKANRNDNLEHMQFQSKAANKKGKKECVIM